MDSLIPAPPESDYQLTSPMEDHSAAPAKFRIHKFLSTLRQFWWVPVITLAVGLVAAVSFILLKAPMFVSSARMWETEKLRLPEGALFSEDPQSYLGTQTELIRSEKLRQMTLARLEALGTNSVPRGKDGQPLAVQLRVTQAPKSSVFAIEASSANPAYTRAYLDALLSEYMEYRKNVRKIVSGDTLGSISEQVLKQERELKAAQEEFNAFQRTNNLAVLQEEGTISGGYLAKLKTQLSDYTLEARILEATAAERMSTNTSNTTNRTNTVAESATNAVSNISTSDAASAETQIASRDLAILRMEREKQSKHLRPKHPKIVKLDADIERSEKVIEMSRKQTQEQLAITRQTLRLKIESVQSSIKEWEQKVVVANNRIAEAEKLKLAVNRTQSLVDRLNTLLQNVDISRNIDRATLAILEPASPALRSRSQELSNLGQAGFGGVALGLGIVLLLAVRDDRFTSLIEVHEKVGDNIVGYVPDVTKLAGANPVALLQDRDERHVYAESYRSLRSALLFLPLEAERPKLMLITSAVPDEGKSTIAANLARTLASGGARVILVDGDLRRGHLHDVLALQSEPGFSDVLRTPGTLDGAIQTNGQSNLSFLSRGSLVHSPGDLFLRPELAQILAQLRERFDYVLIDSSPIFAADDATTLANKVDGTLFVVRNRFSRASAVREALTLLYQRQANILGLVLNRVDAMDRSYHYYKYADYHSLAGMEVAGSTDG